MKTEYFFIINPKSGLPRDNDRITDKITRLFGRRAEIALTKRRGHALELARNAVAKGVRRIVVAGGDGTLNEVLPAVCHTECEIGLVPRGSGNGFAREIGLDLNPLDALDQLSGLKPMAVDGGKFGRALFINAAGIGLDATVAQAFDEFSRRFIRGTLPYVPIVLKEYVNYAPPPVTLRYRGHRERVAPLILTFANSRQYGGGARIAPKARINDGLLDVALISCAPPWLIAMKVPSLFAGTLDGGDIIRYFRVPSATLEFSRPVCYHVDGEPHMTEGRVDVKIMPGAFRFLVNPAAF